MGGNDNQALQSIMFALFIDHGESVETMPCNLVCPVFTFICKIIYRNNWLQGLYMEICGNQAMYDI